MYGVTSGIEAATETAAKLEASLNVKKKLDTTEFPKAFFKNTDVLKIIQAEYSINHCSQAVRNLLCKGATQEKIREHCEAYVSTKGRYIPEGSQPPPNEKSDKAYGLYLFIQGPNKRSVDLAIAMIEGIIATGETRPPALMSLNTTAPPPIPVVGSMPLSQPNMQSMPPPSIHNLISLQVPPPAINLVEKVPIGIDRPLPGFNLPMKLIGQNGSNLQYIRNETGAVVTLRGIGSAFIEPTTGQEAQEVLHFSIEHTKPDGLAAARDLAVNLIATVQQEYAQVQAAQAPVQQVAVDPTMLLQQPPLDQQVMHQPLMATSITLPVVPTPTNFIHQPPVGSVPPPQFNQPPPQQLSLPPPGIHIPTQQGPLVPPPGHPPQQLQLQPSAEQSGIVQQTLQPGQQQQQQYLITQSGQPVQGIMTSQGFVVLNQQPQQVFLSQPPGQAPPVLHQGQLSFQPSGPTSVPVSYQLQYVQSAPPTMSGSPILQHQQPPPQQSHTVVLQPPTQVQFQNGPVHLTQQPMMGLKPGENGHGQPQMVQQGGGLMQVKQVSQTVQLMQQYAPTVHYVSSPGIRPEQTGPAPHKEPRMGKRKFTEEAEPSSSPKQQRQSPHVPQTSPQLSPMPHTQAAPQQQPPQLMQGQQQPHMLPMTSMHPTQILHQQPMMQSQAHLHQALHPNQQPPPIHLGPAQQMHPGQQQMQLPPQQMMQPPPQPYPQPVPHPSQTMSVNQQPRAGVGLHEMMMHQMGRDDGQGQGQQSSPQKSGVDRSPSAKAEGGEETDADNERFLGPGIEQQKENQSQWCDGDPNQKNRNQQGPPDFGFNSFNRRDRSNRERPTFSHYSSKPQLYSYQQYMQSTNCPPPPPPPPPIQQHQQYYYNRR